LLKVVAPSFNAALEEGFQSHDLYSGVL